jgi:hypothetical protein
MLKITHVSLGTRHISENTVQMFEPRQTAAAAAATITTPQPAQQAGAGLQI